MNYLSSSWHLAHQQTYQLPTQIELARFDGDLPIILNKIPLIDRIDKFGITL